MRLTIINNSSQSLHWAAFSYLLNILGLGLLEHKLRRVTRHIQHPYALGMCKQE
jgi:hypothetical protein